MLRSDAEAIIVILEAQSGKHLTLSDDMKDYFTSLAFERVTSQYCTLQERPSIRLILMKYVHTVN